MHVNPIRLFDAESLTFTSILASGRSTTTAANASRPSAGNG